MKLFLFSSFSPNDCGSNQIWNNTLNDLRSSNLISIENKLAKISDLEISIKNCINIHDTIMAKLHNIKSYLFYSSNPILLKEAINEAKLAYNLSLKHNSNTSNILLKSTENLGFYFYMNQDFEKSNEYYNKAIGLTKDSLEKAYFYKTIATTTYLFGDFQKSIEIAKKGMSFSKKGKYETADLLNVISICYKDLGQYELSFNFIKEAINKHLIWEHETKQKDDLSRGIYILNMGNVLVEQRKYSQALKNFKFASKTFFEIGQFDKLIQNGLTNQGDVLEKMDKFNEAKKVYYYAQNLFENRFRNLKDGNFARIYGNLGKIYVSERNFTKAISNFKKAFKVFPNFDLAKVNNLNSILSLKDKSILQDILTDYGNCNKELFLLSKNKKYLNEGIRIFNIADNVIDAMRFDHKAFKSLLYWRKNTFQMYENAIETCYLLKDYEKAYYFMEKSRAVMLNDKLNELGAKQKLNEVDQEKEREYQRKIIELNTKIEAETKTTEKEKLNSQLFDIQEQQERFVKSLETKYPAYYQLKYNTQIGTLKQMQAYLKTNFKEKNATMVSYFFGDSASYAMVISPTKVEVKQFKYDVAQNQEFVNLLATNQGTKADYARILSMGSVVYQKLIKPLNLPKGHLIISQDGVFMPFEALSTSAISAQYLLKDYAISYTYSGQFLLKKQTETKFWPNQTFVGFAPVEFNNQLNTLKKSDVTLGNVAKNYWFSNTFTGKVATKANFLQQAKDHKIVQIFTHAFVDSVDTEPKIYFADQALKISELNAEDQFNTQLLVLSACKTGVGKLAKGEGVLSLARGFSMLGIPATITSLWSVEDKNTYQLTELFYKYLKEGLSKDVALQKAKLEFLELHPNSGPTDWAGMVLVGRTSQLTSNTPAFLVLGVIFSFAIIAGGLYFSRNRKAA